MKKYFGLFLEYPERLFVLLAAFFGICTIFVMPPFLGPDEQFQMYRAYQVSEGSYTFDLNSNGGAGYSYPAGLIGDIGTFYEHTNSGVKVTPSLLINLAQKKIDLNTKNKVFVENEGMVAYSPLAFVPQTIGITIAKNIYPSALIMLYVTRLFNLIAFIGFIYLAIRLTPIGKLSMFVIALFPMAIQQAASASSDVTAIGLGFLAVALFLKLYIQTAKITRRQIFYVLILAVWIGMVKQTYPLLILPFLFLPVKLFNSRRQRITVKLLTLFLSFGSAIIWYLYIKNLGFAFINPSSWGAGQYQQMNFILHNSTSFLHTLFNTFVVNLSPNTSGPSLLLGIFGQFSLLTYAMPISMMLVTFVLLLFTLLVQNNPKLNRKIQVIFLLVFIMSVLAIAATLYLVWTPVGTSIINGIQGRYFLPLLPLLIPIFASIRKPLLSTRVTNNNLTVCIVVVSCINFGIMFLLTLHKFY